MIGRAALRHCLFRAPRAAVPPPPISKVREVARVFLPAPDAPSPWDPEPTALPIELVLEVEEELEVLSEEQRLQEILGSKTLLLEIIRRAAYDWVLYRGHTRLQQRVLAEQAFQWLFVEVPGTPDWAERLAEGKYITSFVAICEGLDLDPDKVRYHIRNLTPKNVLSVGRPAEYRRREPQLK